MTEDLNHALEQLVSQSIEEGFLESINKLMQQEKRKGENDGQNNRSTE